MLTNNAEEALLPHRNPGHAEGVEGPLAAGAVSVHVAHGRLLHVLVLHPGVGKCLSDRLVGHVRVVEVLSLTGLLKLGHPHPHHVHLAPVYGMGGETSGTGSPGWKMSKQTFLSEMD